MACGRIQLPISFPKIGYSFEKKTLGTSSPKWIKETLLGKTCRFSPLSLNRIHQASQRFGTRRYRTGILLVPTIRTQKQLGSSPEFVSSSWNHRGTMDRSIFWVFLRQTDRSAEISAQTNHKGPLLLLLKTQKHSKKQTNKHKTTQTNTLKSSFGMFVWLEYPKLLKITLKFTLKTNKHP